MLLSLVVVLSCAGPASLLPEDNYQNCSGKVTIPDTSGKLHSFSENQTSLETELRVHKRELVRVDGDCCFSIYSEREGAGQLQTFQFDGEHHLEMEVLRSVPLIHPALKFILISMVVMLSLYCIWSKGKEYLFRRRQ